MSTNGLLQIVSSGTDRWIGVAVTAALTLVGIGCQTHTAETTSDAPGRAQQDTPAPGTARVSAGVDTCANQPEGLTCHLSVSTVEAYGMSTPPIGSGQSLQAQLPSHLSDSELSEKKGKHTLLLRFQGREEHLRPRSAPADSLSHSAADNAPDWRIIEIL